MPGKSTDFLILGQGFAGTAVALSLLSRGKSVLVAASPQHVPASALAVGLVNPVTGRRMAKTWNYESVVPRAHEFYAGAYFQIFGRTGTFLERRVIFKALHTVEEMNFLSAKSASEGYDHLICIIPPSESSLPGIFRKTSGWLEITDGGRLNPEFYLSAARQYLADRQSFQQVHWSPGDLVQSAAGFEYQGRRFSSVISTLGLHCPWIGPELWAVKGQVFQFSGFPDWGNAVLKTEKFIIPLGSGEVLMGSTYEREFFHDQTDEEGYAEITADLEAGMRGKLKITHSWAGIRPTTKDRLPVIRRQEKGIYLVNGMGTKGVSLAPYAAGRLLELLQSDGLL